MVFQRPATPVQQKVACLAIGPDVCLSGTESWVARAAASLQPQANIILTMAGDSY